MVDLKPTNAKLFARTVRLTMHATGADEAAARTALEQCGFHVKVAVVALLKKTTVQQAEDLLDQARAACAAHSPFDPPSARPGRPERT